MMKFKVNILPAAVLNLCLCFSTNALSSMEAALIEKRMQNYNGSFESNGGWILKKHNGAQGYIKFCNEPRTGKRALQIVKTNGQGFLQVVSAQPVPVEPKKRYIMRGFYSSQNSKLDSLLLFRITNSANDKTFAYSAGIDQGRGIQSQSILVNSNRGGWAKRIVSYKGLKKQNVYMNILLVGNPVSVILDDVEITLPDYQRKSKPFVDRTTYPYTEKQVFEILEKRPKNEAYVRHADAKSELVLNNKPIVPIMYKAENYTDNMPWNRYTEFGEANVPFVLRTIPLSRSKNNHGVVLGPGKYNFQLIDKLIMHVLKQNPRANIVVSYSINEPYPGWSETHQDEIWQNPEGRFGFGLWGNIEGFVNNLQEVADSTKNRILLKKKWMPWFYPSYSGKSYRETHKKSITDITEYLMKRFGKAVVGFNIGGGHDGQFQYKCPDFSKSGTLAFRNFLQKRYKDINELNKKLKTTYKNFNEIEVPQPLKKNSQPLSININTEYNDFTSNESWGTKHFFANAARDAAGKKVFVISYGRPPEFFPDTCCKEAKGVDISVDQGGYGFRRPGFPVGWRPASTYGLHGKLGLWELDLRTWTYPQRTELYEEWIGIAYTPEMWQAIQRKWSGMVLANNGALWYYSMNRYFDDPDIMKDIKAVTTAAKRIIEAPKNKFRPDVCVIRSEESSYYISAQHSSTRETPNLPMQMIQLETSGVPYDLHQLSDVLTRPELQDYKVYVFMHTAVLTSADRKIIKDKLMKPGKTLLFIYNSGYINENGKSLGAMKELTGFTVSTRDAYARATPLLNPEHPLGKGINPMISGGELKCNMLTLRGKNRHAVDYQVFKIQSAKPSEVLAGYTNGGVAAAARTTPDNCRVIYSAAPFSLSSGLFHRIAKTAGAYTVGAPGQSIHMNGNFLSFHGVTPGRYTITLPPGTSKVLDPFSGKILASNIKTYTFEAKVGQTLWFLFEK